MTELFRTRVASLLVLAVIGGALVFLFTPLEQPTALDDGLRHDAMGRLIASEGISAATWDHFLWAGYLKTHPVDPWFLSDVLYAPLSPLSPVRAMQAYAVFSILLLVVAFLAVLRRQRAHVLLAVIAAFFLVFLNQHFFYRLLLGRPYVLLTAIFLWVIASILGKRAFQLSIALALAVLLSYLFVFPLFAALLGLVWLWLRSEDRDVKKLGIAIAVGVFIGLVLHPHVFEYVRYVFFIFFKIPFLTNIEKASEMLATPSRVFEAVLITLSLLPSIILEHRKSAGTPSSTEFLGWLVIIFGAVTCLWPRGIDYLWPTALLFLTCFLSSRMPLSEGEVAGPVVRRMFLACFFLFLCSAIIYLATSRGLYASDPTRSLAPYTEAFTSVPSGSKVLNVDWHLFPPFVAARPDLQYATGMDAAFTALQDPEAATLLHDLVTPAFRDALTTEAARTWLASIRKIYPGDFIALDVLRHEKMVEALTTIGLKKVSGGEMVAVFDLR